MNETAEELCEFDLPRVTDAEVIDVDTEVFSELCQTRTGLDAREEEKERERMSDIDFDDVYRGCRMGGSVLIKGLDEYRKDGIRRYRRWYRRSVRGVRLEGGKGDRSVE